MAKRQRDARLPAKLYFKIGEVAKLTDLAPSVLRYWETEFKGFLKPEKSPSGHRLYKRRDVELVRRLRKLLYERKYTIAGARAVLAQESRDGTTRETERVRDDAERREAQLLGKTEDVIATLRKAVRELRAVVEQDARLDPSMPKAVEGGKKDGPIRGQRRRR